MIRLRQAVRARDGFNLIELMVVLVVIGIVLAAAVPSFTERNARNRVEGEGRMLSSRMQLARQKAVSRRYPYRMVLDRAAKTYGFERQDSDSSWTPDPDEEYGLAGVSTMTTDIGGSSTASEVHFETRGTVRSEDSPALIRFINLDGDTAVVSMVRTGRVTIRVGSSPD